MRGRVNYFDPSFFNYDYQPGYPESIVLSGSLVNSWKNRSGNKDSDMELFP